MKKVIALALALLMVFALFAGCGKKEEKKTETDSGSSKPNTSTTTTAPSGSTITTEVTTATTDVSREELTEDKVYPSDDAVINLAYSSEQTALIITGNAVASGSDVGKLFYETLCAWDQKVGDYVGVLATNWEWVDDLTLRVYLRNDVTSTLGDPFTANDVLYTIKWNAETAKMASYVSALDIDKCKVIDDYTIDIVCKQPYPYLVMDLAGSGYQMVVEKSVEKIGGKEATLENPAAATGAYVLVEWDRAAQVIKTERRDDYWGTTPYFKYINYYCVGDGASRVMGVEAGDYDWAYNPSRSQVVAAEDNSKLTAWKMLSQGSTNCMIINSDIEPLNVLEARQALALAIDYEAILKVAAAGLGEVDDSPLMSSFNQYYSAPGNPDKNFIKHDEELAKQKLVEAGYPEGFTINCKYRANDTMTVATAEALQNMFGKVGITLELLQQESATWMTDMRAGDFNTNLTVGGQVSPIRQLNTIDPRVGHDAASGASGTQWYPEEDEQKLLDMIDKCKFTVDDAARMQAWAEMQDYCRERVPMVIMTSCLNCMITSPRIAGFQSNSGGAALYTSFYEAEYLEGPAK